MFLEDNDDDKKETSLKDEIKKLSEMMKEEKIQKSEKKSKKFKLPSRAKISKAKDKKNWVTIMFINENGNVDFKREQIHEQTTSVDGCPRIATSDTVLRYKGKPIIIQPSWSVKPFSPADHYKESELHNMNSKGYRLLMNRMQTEAMKAKAKMNMLLILGVIAIAGVVIYALFFGK